MEDWIAKWCISFFILHLSTCIALSFSTLAPHSRIINPVCNMLPWLHRHINSRCSSGAPWHLYCEYCELHIVSMMLLLTVKLHKLLAMESPIVTIVNWNWFTKQWDTFFCLDLEIYYHIIVGESVICDSVEKLVYLKYENNVLLINLFCYSCCLTGSSILVCLSAF